MFSFQLDIKILGDVTIAFRFNTCKAGTVCRFTLVHRADITLSVGTRRCSMKKKTLIQLNSVKFPEPFSIGE